MGAVSADREHVSAATHEQHRLLPHVADQLAAVRQFGVSNSLREIRTDRLNLAFSHSVLLRQFFARAFLDMWNSTTPKHKKDGHKAT
jgi:hypothetical protein